MSALKATAGRGVKSWAEGVHTVNMAHAQSHWHKRCGHAVMLPEH